MTDDEWSVEAQRTERRFLRREVPPVVGVGLLLLMCLAPAALGLLLLSGLQVPSFDLGDVSFGGPYEGEDCSSSSEGIAVAAWNGNDAAIRARLDDGTAPDTVDGDDRTALYCAARAGHRSTVGLLLEAGADPNIANAAGDTPVLWAAQNGDPDIVQQLLDGEADPNLATHDGHTPLFRALAAQQYEAAATLVGGGARVDQPIRVYPGEVVTGVATAVPVDATIPDPTWAPGPKNTSWRTPQNVHCYAGLVEGDPGPSDVPLLWNGLPAVPYNAGALCTFLFGYVAEGGGDVQPLHLAGLAGESTLTQALLDAGANPEALALDAFTALHTAAMGGDPATVRLLLDRGADPTPGTTAPPPHELARWLGHEEAAQILQAAALANP